MPIQFPDIQRISFNEANPGLVGAERGQALMQNFMQFPQDLQAKILANKIAEVNAQYAKPMAEGNLTKLNQENQWNPKIWGSEIGLRGAQSGLYGAQTKNLGVETQTNQMKLDYLKQMLGSRDQGGMNPAGGGAIQGAGATVMGNAGVGTSAPGQAQSGQQQQQQPQQQPQNNSLYGVDIPQPTHQDIANKMLMGIDTFSPKQQNAKTQIQDQYKQYQKATADSIQEATAANNMNQAINVFNNSMDKSFYRGQRLGHIESSGILSPPGDMSPEQESDRAALQMLPAAIETLKDAMGSARFSNLDMGVAGKMKFDRTMNDETRATQTQWLQGVNQRMMEKAKFLSYVGNPEMGVKKAQADQLWSAYQQDFPLISEDGKTFQGTNLGNWPLYTTPRAISSIQSTGSYSPSKSEKNVFMMQVPDGRGGYQIMPIKKGKVESAFRKGAKPV